MARRILDTAFWDDTDVAKLSYSERLLLICMITDEALSNDYGWLPAHPALLRKHAFGYDECTVPEVKAWRDHILDTCKNVKLYSVNGQEYIDLVKFREWQKIRYKRKTHLPPPPWRKQSDKAIPEDSRNSAETCGNSARNTETSRPTVTKPPLGCVGLGSDGQGREGLGSDGLKAPEDGPETDSDKALVRQALELRGRSEGEVVTGGEHLQMLQWGKEYGAQVLLKACQATFDACPTNFGAYLRKILEA